MSDSLNNQQQPSSPCSSPGLSPTPSSPARSRRGSKNLTLDLSSIPPLTQPAKPTNTLLITNLSNPAIFSQPHITQLRDIINSTAPLMSWSPLKSFRRIVCSFTSTDHAVAVRRAIDGEVIMGDRVRVYFGEHTPLEPVHQHLAAPEFKKLFFISPPPSPPHGWQMRNEDPPNSVVVAEDLAQALAKLSWDPKNPLLPSNCDNSTTTMAIDSESRGRPVETSDPAYPGHHQQQPPVLGRPRSASSVVLFEPEDANKEDMPAISVDDYTDSGDDDRSPVSPVSGGKIVLVKASIHTPRPPTELMNHQ